MEMNVSIPGKRCDNQNQNYFYDTVLRSFVTGTEIYADRGGNLETINE